MGLKYSGDFFIGEKFFKDIINKRAPTSWRAELYYCVLMFECFLYFFTKKTGQPYSKAEFKPGDFLIFGKETKGLPEEILRLYADRCYTIPMSNPKIRSINLANAAGIVLYEALRQQSLW